MDGDHLLLGQLPQQANCLFFRNGRADPLVDEIRQPLLAAFHHADDADIPASAPPGLDHIPIVQGEAGSQHIVDLAGRAAEILGQLVALQLDLGFLLAQERFDKALNGIA